MIAELSTSNELTSDVLMRIERLAFGQISRWLHLKEGVWQRRGMFGALEMS